MTKSDESERRGPSPKPDVGSQQRRRPFPALAGALPIVFASLGCGVDRHTAVDVAMGSAYRPPTFFLDQEDVRHEARRSGVYLADRQLAGKGRCRSRRGWPRLAPCHFRTCVFFRRQLSQQSARKERRNKR